MKNVEKCPTCFHPDLQILSDICIRMKKMHIHGGVILQNQEKEISGGELTTSSQVAVLIKISQGLLYILKSWVVTTVLLN